MVKIQKLLKALRLMTRPAFARAALQHRVAAAVEHIDVIRHTAAATLIDVGANKGQFSLAFHTLRPRAAIQAFEPLGEAADKYGRLFDADRRIALHRVALADEAQNAADFYVTDRRDSSSLLKPASGQNEAFGVRSEGQILVDVRRLDECLRVEELTHPILLKIDVQGAELSVLRGCRELELIDFVYVELSFTELYEGQPLYDEVAAYLATRGFALAGVFNQVMTDSFGPTQADFLFKRGDPGRLPAT
jgi:FkbM family methyltransferase